MLFVIAFPIPGELASGMFTDGAHALPPRSLDGRLTRRGKRWVAGHGLALPQSSDLLLQLAVPADQSLDGLISAAAALDLLELALQPLDVLLGARPDSSLGLAVVGAFAGQLRRGQGEDAAHAWALLRCRSAGLILPFGGLPLPQV